MESVDYAAAAADLCAAGINAPHIRQRLYWVADSTHRDRGTGCDGKTSQRSKGDGELGWRREAGGLGDSQRGGREGGNESERRSSQTWKAGRLWDRYDILSCTDGKSRRVESGTFPLVDGLPRGVVPGCDISGAYAQATAEERVMRLRGYGNAIVPQLAAEFIQASVEAIHDTR